MPAAPKLPDIALTERFAVSLALFEAMEAAATVGKRMKPVKKLALCCITTGEADTTREAAEALGISQGAMYNLTRAENGKKYMALAQKKMLTNEGRRAIGRIARIARQEKNLPQAMRANEWLAGVNGISPTQKHEVDHKNKAPSVGMLVIHPDAASPDMLDRIFPAKVVSEDTQSPVIEGQAVEINDEN